MSEAASANAPKPSSSVKLVLLGEAAVGKVLLLHSSCYTIINS
jgi:Ras-related protein Rab-5C